MVLTKLAVEPIGIHYRIVIKGTGGINRPVLYSSDLPLETMEEICQIMEDRYEQVYREGWADGYSQGWDDCTNDEVKK